MSGYQGTQSVSISLSSHGDMDKNGPVNWRWQTGTPYVPSPVLVGNYLYFTGGNGNQLTILDANIGKPLATGERIPSVRQYYASPIFAGGRVYFTDRDGVAAVLKPGPKLDLLATNKLGDPAMHRLWPSANNYFCAGPHSSTALNRESVTSRIVRGESVRTPRAC
jgi:outer membrane protein assembly factor BamB